VALWNPEGRELKFVIGTYLPRNMFPPGRKEPPTDDELDHAALEVTGANGQVILADRAPLRHLHGEPATRSSSAPARRDPVRATDAEHFWTYTYPAHRW